MARMNYAQAACAALERAMAADARVVALGEDVGRGGIFGQYRGLQQKFGATRVIDTPISESTIMGAAVGMALTGLRPVVEMRVVDFALCAMDEIVNQAAKARYMFGGQTRVPLVVRHPIGIWRSSAAQHSQSLEAWYAHVPGLVVVCPSTPADNYGLLQSAIRCDDPVVYMEHKNLWALEGDVPTDSDEGVPLGKARVERRGKDATLVTWSGTVHVAARAAATLADAGIDLEIIDLRTLWPWDKACVLESVERTRRLIVAHEAVAVGGYGAEIAATVASRLHYKLAAPVMRLGAPRVPVSYAPTLEDAVRVTDTHIVEAVKRLVRG